MSSTSSITSQSTTAAGTSNSATSAASLGGVSANEDTFLTLLVSQLKNQDPLSPTDGTQFVSELAQFSSLEQLITINQNVASVSKVVSPSTAVSAASSSSSNSSSSDGSSTSGSNDITPAINTDLSNGLMNNLG
jgi:flagellar basal-body rod modification protein FlgD